MANNKLFKATVATVSLVIMFGMAVPALSFPSALNLIPCTDHIGSGNLRVSYESDGSNSPYDNPNTQYIYTQYGINTRVEVGVDFYDVESANDTYFNAKYTLFDETKKRPAVAVGALSIGDIAAPSYYAVGCKEISCARLHFGIQTNSDSAWALIGVDKKISKALTLIADYQSGKDQFSSLGLYWQVNPTLGVGLYYARNNTMEMRDSSDFVGLNFGYILPIGK